MGRGLKPRGFETLGTTLVVAFTCLAAGRCFFSDPCSLCPAETSRHGIPFELYLRLKAMVTVQVKAVIKVAGELNRNLFPC